MNALLAELSDDHHDYYSMERLNLLANLIADGILDIKIAFTQDVNGIGMYHEKMGIVTDADGNQIAFSGSNNESATAMQINYETMDVFRGWGDGSEQERVALKRNAFASIWNNSEPNIDVLEFPKVSQTLIDKYKRKNPNYGVDREQFHSQSTIIHHSEPVSDYAIVPHLPRIPEGVELHEYQTEAIAA